MKSLVIVMGSLVTLGIVMVLGVVVGEIAYRVITWVAKKLKIIPSHT